MILIDFIPYLWVIKGVKSLSKGIDYPSIERILSDKSK
jgi:hypothetical protein